MAWEVFLGIGGDTPLPHPNLPRVPGEEPGKFSEQNGKIVAIGLLAYYCCNAHWNGALRSLCLSWWHPTHFFDVGIAEEHATLLACGLATQGMKSHALPPIFHATSF
jgi:hypothetical protein